MQSPRLISTEPAGIAAVCGHAYNIQTWINSEGETVIRHDAYTNPDDPQSAYDANDLCHRCYVAAMERRPRMSFQQMTRAFGGR